MKRRIQATLVLLTMNIAAGSAESLAGGMGRSNSHKLAYASSTENTAKDKNPIRLFNSKRTKAAEEAQKRAALAAEEEKHTERKSKATKGRKAAEKTEKTYAASSKQQASKNLYTPSRIEKEAEERRALIASEEKSSKKKNNISNTGTRTAKAANTKTVKEEVRPEAPKAKVIARAKSDNDRSAIKTEKKHTFIANRELKPQKPEPVAAAPVITTALSASETGKTATIPAEQKTERHIYSSASTDNSFPAAGAVSERKNVPIPENRKSETVTVRNNKEEDKAEKTTASSENENTATALTPEQENISNGFANNKGQLAWPVANGYISAPYGRFQHPTEKGVMLENNGIDITTSESSPVYSVFSGQVSKIFYVPGRGTTLLINHGNYYTVYSGLVKINVKVGNKVAGRQVIGNVGTNDDGNSILHFEVWHANGSANVGNVNPTAWLAPR